MEEHCITCEVWSESLCKIQINFSVFELLITYSIQYMTPATRKLFSSVCNAPGTLGTVPYTIKILFVMPSVEMCSGVKCNAVLYYGNGYEWGTARKRIINLLKPTGYVMHQ